MGEHTADRGRDTYVSLLQLTVSPGDRILDVGGSAGTFAKEVHDDAVVDSLDMFSTEDVEAGRVSFARADGEEAEYWPHNRITGDITKGLDGVPDGTYDHVVSMYTVPTWMNTYEDTVKALREMTRVCKVGGDVRMFPMWQNNKRYDGFVSKGNLQLAASVFRRHGHVFQIEEVTGNPHMKGASGAHRIVIVKGAEGIPPEEEFQKQSFIQCVATTLRNSYR